MAGMAGMAGMGARDPAVDRSLRSVFVGNIPYEATEEQLKDIFSEVGPVVSFRLVYDRETGKPKGYGFCEYQDQETALSAMRNLNGREFSGRALRVDNAASEKNKEELKSLGTGTPIMESPYGEPVSPEEAPESISRAVASLPPEQMFELMKQMKLCVQNSPQEARNMLLQNPQLAYALLQAQVVMRIVDPEIAVKILHRPAIATPLNQQQPPGPAGPPPGPQTNQPNPAGPKPQQMGGMHVNGAPTLIQPSPMQGGLQGPGPVPSSLPGPVPGPPGGGLQPQIGHPTVGPLPMDRGPGSLQHSPVGPVRSASMERVPVSMPDPRAPLQRGPPVSNVPPRGLLGDNPNDPRGPTLIKDDPRGFMGPPPQGQPMHQAPGQDHRGPPLHEMRGGPMGEPRPMMGEPRPMMGEPRPMMGEPRPMMGDNRPMMGDNRPMMGDNRPMMGDNRPMMGDNRPMMGDNRPMMGDNRPMMGDNRPMMGDNRPMMGDNRPMMGDNRPMMGDNRPMMGDNRPMMGDNRPMMGDNRPMMGDNRPMMGDNRPMMGDGRGPMMDRGVPPMDNRGGRDPRAIEPRGMDSRVPVPSSRGQMPVGMPGPGPMNIGSGAPQGPRPVPGIQGGGQGGFSPGQNQVTPQDHEKAALIMQVLQLTPDQIAMLPPEQRQSILILKEQIQKSTGAP
ncbi:cleavage stimulation factor subunit 2 isoform X3 [Pleurodeles waltl]|uniref:cleavage stimulation factor subunit 2 isoform X3 n=1 Tax=Pleurodeles waltl TaxID=8319 RepID=UPI003709BBC3